MAGFRSLRTSRFSGGGNPRKARTATIVPPVTLPIVTLSPLTAISLTVGTPFTRTFVASGGTAPYTYAVVGGSLPAGLSLAGAVLSGTPTVSGAFSFSVRAIDTAGNPSLIHVFAGVVASEVIADTTPDAFVFTDATNAALSATQNSNTITVTGLGSGVSAPVTVMGGSYIKNGSSPATISTTAVNGDTFALAHTTSASNSTAVNTTLTIGGVSDTFTSTTLAAIVSAPALIWSSGVAVLNPSFTITGIEVGDTVTLTVLNVTDNVTHGSEPNPVDFDEASAGSLTFSAIPTLAQGKTYSATVTVTRNGQTSEPSNVVTKTMSGTPVVLSEGDSITKYDTGDGWLSYARLWAGNTTGISYNNTAVGGGQLGYPGDASSVNSLYGRIAADKALAPSVMSVLIGANDFSTSDPTGYVNRILAYTDQFKAIGSKVIVCTILPRTLISGWNAARATANTAIRAAKTAGRIDDVVDFDTCPVGVDGAENNTTLYGDGLHPSASAQITLSRIYTPVMNHWIGKANEPLDFAFAPQAAGTTDTDYDSPTYTVKGLYPGETRPYSVQSGKAISKNGGSFVVNGSGTVVNDDTIKVRNHSSVSAATQTDVSVTIGTTTATYSVTTAGAGSRDWVPTDLGTKLKLWLTPEAITDAGGAQMNAWPDSSGNSVTVTGVASGNKPTVVASGLNGKKTVSFSGANQSRFTLPSTHLSSRTGTAGSSTFFVSKNNLDPPTAYFDPPIKAWGTGSGGEFYPYSNGSVYTSYCTDTRYQTVDIAPALDVWRFASFHSKTNDLRYYVDGTLLHSEAGSVFATGTSPTIGSNEYDGQMAEVVDCNSALTTTERQLVEGYLAWKYGLQANLPAGHPYLSAKPTI